MNVDKLYQAGNGEVSIAIGTYYLDKEGNRFPTAKEAGDGYTAKAEVGLGLDFQPDTWADDVRAAALQHSYTRKAQEHFQAVKRSGGDFQQAVDTWPETYAKLIKGERERAAGVKVDSTETLAIKYLANVLRAKVADGSLANAKVPFPRTDDPPKTEKGVINYIAWAKIGKEEGHPWYAGALKKVSPDEKSFG